MQYKVEMFVEVTDENQHLVNEKLPRMLEERLRGTEFGLLHIYTVPKRKITIENASEEPHSQ